MKCQHDDKHQHTNSSCAIIETHWKPMVFHTFLLSQHLTTLRFIICFCWLTKVHPRDALTVSKLHPRPSVDDRSMSRVRVMFTTVAFGGQTLCVWRTRAGLQGEQWSRFTCTCVASNCRTCCVSWNMSRARTTRIFACGASPGDGLQTHVANTAMTRATSEYACGASPAHVSQHATWVTTIRDACALKALHHGVLAHA